MTTRNKTRPRTGNGRRSNRTDGDWYDDPSLRAVLDKPMNAPPTPPTDPHRSNNSKRPRDIATESLQQLPSGRSQPRPLNGQKRNRSANQPLQTAKVLQKSLTNGVKTTASGARQRNNCSTFNETKRVVPLSFDNECEELEMSTDQRTLPLQEHLKKYDYLNRPIPRKSNSSTSFDSALPHTRPRQTSSATKYSAGKVLDLCDGEGSETEVDNSSSNRLAEESSSSAGPIYSPTSAASSTDGSMCRSPAPERPTPPPPEATHDSSSTISTRKDWQPPPIEIHEIDDDEKPPHVETPLYLDVLRNIEHEAVVRTTTTPTSHSPSRFSVIKQVESAVASVQKTCTSFFSKVNGVPKAKVQSQIAFLSGVRKHAAQRIQIGSTIPRTPASAKDDRIYVDDIDEYEEDYDSPPRKRNSRSSNSDDDEYRPEDERPRKGLKQTKLTTGSRESRAEKQPTAATRKSKRNSRQRPEDSIIEIESSSDEESVRDPEPQVLLSQDPIHLDLVPLKISIGRNVFHQAQLELHVDPRHENRCQLILSYKLETQRRTKSRTLRSSFQTDEKSEERSHLIPLGVDLREMKFYFHNQAAHGNGSNERFQNSFLAMNVKSNHDNGLAVYSKSYKPDSDNFMLRNIVVVLSSIEDLDRTILALQRNATFAFYVTDASRINAEAATDYCGAILEDEALERHDEKAKFLDGKDQDEIMLLYPFGDSTSFMAMDEAASGLGELGCVLNRENMVEGTAPTANAAVEPKLEKDEMDMEKDDGLGEESKTVLAFSVSTIERLKPGVYLNDTLIDFWLQWIWRNCDKVNIHYFTTLFFTTLEKNGPDGVARWTEKRGVDIFTKKFIFIPINKNQHWSLCVVINPGAIVEHRKVLEEDDEKISNGSKENNPYPCLLFFDSLKTHAKGRFAKLIRNWLNSEWNRLYPKHALDAPFDARSMKLCTPEIPYQMNSWDCGVYVCRYAYAMYLLRKSRFTYSEVEYSEVAPSFRTLIVEHDAFRFDADDIHRIREEYLCLVERLSKLYMKWKKEDDHKRFEARRAKKMEAECDRRNEQKDSHNDVEHVDD